MPPSTTVPALATALACAVLLCACASAQKPAEGISDAALQPREHVEELSADGLFAFGRADIARGGNGPLDALATTLADGRQVVGVQVVGHSDRIGTDRVNLALSARRAEAVRDYLVARGVAASLISAEGRGSSEPVVECTRERGPALIACLAPNRRVEIRAVYVD